MTYPEDCIQNIVTPSWWIENKEKRICRGALVFAFVPHVDQQPYTFEPYGRKEATNHEEAIINVTPLKVKQPLKPSLPVAAMPNYANEVWGAYRAKKRPCILIRSDLYHVDKNLTKGKPNHLTAPTYSIVPYYGADENGTRAGYTQIFRERVKRCEYPHYLWDKLPVNGSDESILRLDHLMPCSSNYNAVQLTPYMLSDEAMMVIEDLLTWSLHGGIPSGSIILDFQQIIQEVFA